jgi:hypothetical protein
MDRYCREFLSIDGYIPRCIDPQADSPTFYFQHVEDDSVSVSDQYALTNLPGQNQTCVTLLD